jgi:hypothetical protein
MSSDRLLNTYRVHAQSDLPFRCRAMKRHPSLWISPRRNGSLLSPRIASCNGSSFMRRSCLRPGPCCGEGTRPMLPPHRYLDAVPVAAMHHVGALGGQDGLHRIGALENHTGVAGIEHDSKTPRVARQTDSRRRGRGRAGTRTRGLAAPRCSGRYTVCFAEIDRAKCGRDASQGRCGEGCRCAARSRSRSRRWRSAGALPRLLPAISSANTCSHR